MSLRRCCVVVLTLGLLAGCGAPGFDSSEPVSGYLAPASHAHLPSAPASYLGVYEPGVPRKMTDVRKFTAAVGRAPNLLLYYSGWGQPFASAFAEKAFAVRASLVVQLDPGTTSISAIAKGRYDSYLRGFAEQVRRFGRPVVIGFAREMNGRWYPWGWGHVSPRTWVAAWRRVVVVFRHAGALNVTWQWTVNDLTGGVANPRPWWPGAAYVNWIGIDGYYYSRRDTFDTVFGSTLEAVRRFAAKPILISEVAMAPQAAPAGQMADLFDALWSRHLLGLEWFDAAARHDWRLENDPVALSAFRRQVLRLTRLATVSDLTWARARGQDAPSSRMAGL
jgi:mannan endo-1,4-beta-mannosidase